MRAHAGTFPLSFSFACTNDVRLTFGTGTLLTIVGPFIYTRDPREYRYNRACDLIVSNEYLDQEYLVTKNILQLDTYYMRSILANTVILRSNFLIDDLISIKGRSGRLKFFKICRGWLIEL